MSCIHALGLGSLFLLMLSSPVMSADSRIPALERLENGSYRVLFTYPSDSSVRTVSAAGSFNHWDTSVNPLILDPGTGLYSLSLVLSPGYYTYKFLVNGADWRPDSFNKDSAPDGFGGFNSVMTLGTEPERLLELSKKFGPDVHIAHTRMVPSNPLLKPRPIFVWLPPGYEDSPSRHFPVLYMHDGQNIWDDSSCCFGHGGWFVNQTSKNLLLKKKISPFIIVGIPNTSDRMTEYMPPLKNDDTQAYAEFLVNEVKPFIDKKYRTLSGPENTALAGSSMGGLISLWMTIRFPEIFGKAACLSTSFWILGRNNVDTTTWLGGHLPVRLYLDSGTEGETHDGMEETRRWLNHLQANGFREGKDLEYFLDRGASHNEGAWRKRFYRALVFLFPSAPRTGANLYKSK